MHQTSDYAFIANSRAPQEGLSRTTLLLQVQNKRAHTCKVSCKEPEQQTSVRRSQILRRQGKRKSQNLQGVRPGGNLEVPLECTRKLMDQMDIRIDTGFHHKNPNVYIPSSCVRNPNNQYSRKYMPLTCLLYTSPSPRDATLSRMPSSA